MKLTGITIIIWDLDNTLYKRDPQLQTDLREAEITVIRNHTGWTRQKAYDEFNAIHRSVYQSATAASAHLANISIPVAAAEMEHYFNRLQYIHHDNALVTLFDHLSSYQHFILTNGVREQATLAIRALGLSPSLFREIVTSEQTGMNKPDPAGFLYIMDKTRKQPEAHLMVGDRDEVDIEPAHTLGLKTCFAWGESTIADVSIPTIYDIETVLT